MLFFNVSLLYITTVTSLLWLCLAEHSHCIQHNFTLYFTATITMEHILDKSNISGIEYCFGARRQKSNLLKLLLMKGNSACTELLRVVEVGLKRLDLLQTMIERSANIKERGIVCFSFDASTSIHLINDKMINVYGMCNK